MSFRTRFAPSPTGPLHLGHAYSAILAHDMAMAHGGEFLLRIEDIDQSRARPEWEQQIYDDLDWLGLTWSTPVLRQSDRVTHYATQLDALWGRKLLYQCNCNRKDIAAAIAAPQEGVTLVGPDGPVYPGTCRKKQIAEEVAQPMPTGQVLRLKMKYATLASPDGFSFVETGSGTDGETGRISFAAHEVNRNIGDIVLARRDMGTSYHLSVVLDDAAQGITHVIRGQDLFEATKIHVVLQQLFDLQTPTYHHHKLIRDDQGKRLAKRDDARAISKYREDGYTPDDIRKMVGLLG
ncbi:MAG: tRNA glutamyl-Q(34) synthetase GluQRS [Pseudomonadota bacterium]